MGNALTVKQIKWGKFSDYIIICYTQVNTIRENGVHGRRSGNCAIAIRAAADVFVIYGCVTPGRWIIKRLNCDNEHQYLDIYERGRYYEVRMLKEEFEDTKGVIRICISKKNRQHNDQKKKYIRDKQQSIYNIHIKLKIEKHEPH